MSEVTDEQSTLDPKLKSMLEIADPKDKNFIYCATCSHVVTTVEAKMQVGGNHEHFLTNPHGFQFQLGCFTEALGCDISGQGEAADSWFMGYVWRLASCAECHTHLGWYFSATQGEHYFYGLILPNIQEEP